MTVAPREGSAAIRRLLASGEEQRAGELVVELVRDALALEVETVRFTMDEYSLNSVSGRLGLRDGRVVFFKFHQEDGEERHVAEYYQARLLEDAGLPVEVPLATSEEPGRQITLYRLRVEPRLADVCVAIERADGRDAHLPPALLAARNALDRRTGEVLVATASAPQPSSARAAIHQLFWHRLVDDRGSFPGGRYADWYASHPEWERLADKTWRVNGVELRSSLSDLAATAARLLDPARLATGPVVTAHGDDHQGNIWVLGPKEKPDLRVFDPAFAGRDVPALLAPVKATFHNALAHPFWLYHPLEAAARFDVRVEIGPSEVEVVHDALLPPLRLEILASVADLVWRPLLGALEREGLLADDWREVVRAALFCCPLLVTNLLAPGRPEPVQMLGLAAALSAGGGAVDGSDEVSRLLEQVAP